MDSFFRILFVGTTKVSVLLKMLFQNNEFSHFSQAGSQLANICLTKRRIDEKTYNEIQIIYKILVEKHLTLALSASLITLLQLLRLYFDR